VAERRSTPLTGRSLFCFAQWQSAVQLPKSFGKITVGCDLFLSDNNLTSLPESFVKITGPKSLWLDHNQQKLLPPSFNITVNIIG
jgi:hypothetical protein